MQPFDDLTRFLFYKKKEINFVARAIKTAVFSKAHEKGFSVYKSTDICHDRVWSLARRDVVPAMAKQNRPLIGRFDLEARHYLDSGLQIEADNKPFRHHNIHGMPIPSTEIARNLSRRQLMVNNSRLHLIEDNPSWAKYSVIKTV